MKFAYHAIDKSGQAVAGAIDADALTQATEKLYAAGVYVTSIAPAAGAGTGAAAAAKGALLLGGNRLKQVAAVTRQLAVLTSTGTPVVQALAAVERQLPAGRCKAAVADVLRRVEEGSTMSAAMSEHPDFFDAVYRSLIAAGESGGQLPKMLERLGTMTRKQLKIRNTVAGALAYPIMLSIMAVCVVVVMLLAVLPKFTGLFKTLDAPIPPTTKFLMSVSESMQAYWWAWAGTAIALVAGTIVGLRSAPGRLAVDSISLRLPVFGKFVQSLITARIIRTLGVLLEGRVQLLEALQLVKDAAGNTRYRALVAKAEDSVTRGDTISSAFRDNPLIAPSIYEALLTGERSGQIAPILLNLAEFLDEDNEVIIKSLMSLIEPLILIVLGVVVGFVALSLFLPLFDLTSAAGSGAK